MLFFLKQICKNSVTIHHASSKEPGWAFLSIAGTDYSIPSQPDVALTSIKKRYETENQIIKAISTGHIKEAFQCYYYFSSYHFSPRTESVLRDKKNSLLAFNTLFRKAAEIGRVHPFHIDNLSNQLCTKIENSISLEQLDYLGPQMIRKYCNLVNNYAYQSDSDLVQNCINTIEFYYNTDLSLSQLAEKFSVSKSYLSTLFKRETGLSITDYINKIRVQQAIVLLNTTLLSIGEIASRCGFYDANYFSRIFKKIEGQTPTQYRHFSTENL